MASHQKQLTNFNNQNRNHEKASYACNGSHYGFTGVWSSSAGKTIIQDLTASKINTSNNGTAIWLVHKRNQQLFGTRVGLIGASKLYYEAGMYNLPNGVEYALTWDYENDGDKQMRQLDFSGLDLNNVKVQLTTGSNFVYTKDKMPTPEFTEGAAEGHVTAKMFIYSLPDKEGRTFTAVLDYGVVADDVTKSIEYLPKSVSIDTPDGKMFVAVKSMKFLFENVIKKKDWVGLRKTTFPIGGEL